jgi:hypothetical protein
MTARPTASKSKARQRAGRDATSGSRAAARADVAGAARLLKELNV